MLEVGVTLSTPTELPVSSPAVAEISIGIDCANLWKDDQAEWV